jgi:hypothetical protein
VSRPYIECSIVQLRNIFLDHRPDLAVLGDLRVELEHRKTKGARQLLREIEALVGGQVPRPSRPARAARPEDQVNLFSRSQEHDASK